MMTSEILDPGPALDEPLLILIPVFNDWPSLSKLLDALDDTLAEHNLEASVLVVDDGSTTTPGDDPTKRSFRALRYVEILELCRNLGHQRAIAIGLAYVEDRGSSEAVVVMDGDGEDDPRDVPRLLAKCREEGGRKIIFAERTRRSETVTFRIFYALYRTAHRFLTGYGVRVGNFSVIPRPRLASLVVVSEMWNHYAAAAFKSRQPYATIPTQRAKRLDGKSQMNFVNLVVHGLSAISVYGELVGIRLLVVTVLLMLATLAGLAGVLFIRLATPLAIPGWATNAGGILLVILFQALMLSLIFSFVILGGRQGSAFLPRRDYVYFIGRATGRPARARGRG
jgi:polyisoprenyl-phosphate glycosyltransferase